LVVFDKVVFTDTVAPTVSPPTTPSSVAAPADTAAP